MLLDTPLKGLKTFFLLNFLQAGSLTSFFEYSSARFRAVFLQDSMPALG